MTLRPRVLGILSLLALAAGCKSGLPTGALKSDTAEAGELANGEAPALIELVTRSNTDNRVFLPTPLVAQQRNYTCGVASLMSVLAYYGDQVREGQLQRLLKSDRNNGTSYKDILAFLTTLNQLTPAKRAKLFDTSACEEDFAPADYAKCVTGLPSSALQAAKAHRRVKASKKTLAKQYQIDLRPGIGHDFYADADLAPEEQGTKVPRDGFTLRQLLEALRGGRPVIVLIQAFADGKPLDPKTWGKDENGHYVVATGFDDDNVYFMDPWTVGAWTYIPRALFAVRWHDVDSVTNPDGASTDTPVRHFGLVLSREDRGEDPFAFGALTVPRLD